MRHGAEFSLGIILPGRQSAPTKQELCCDTSAEQNSGITFNSVLAAAGAEALMPTHICLGIFSGGPILAGICCGRAFCSLL
jgi:hypothetical protein